MQIDIIWKSNTISLMKSESTKKCWLCAVEQMVISWNFDSISTSTRDKRQEDPHQSSSQSDLLRGGVRNCKTRSRKGGP
jgi:hypothetical protein